MITIANRHIQPLLSIMHALSRKLKNIPLSTEIAIVRESIDSEDTVQTDLSTITNLLLKLLRALPTMPSVELSVELANLSHELYKKDDLQSSIAYTSDERALYKQFETLWDLMIERIYLSENATVNLNTILFTSTLSESLHQDTIEKVKLMMQRELWRLIEKANTPELQKMFYVMPHLKELLSAAEFASQLPDEYSKYKPLKSLLEHPEDSQPNPLVAIIVNTEAEFHAMKTTTQALNALGIPYRLNQLPYVLLPLFVSNLQTEKVKLIICSNQWLSSAVIGTDPRMPVIVALRDTTLHLNPAINAALRAANTLAPFYPEIDHKLKAYNEQARKAMAEQTQDTRVRQRTVDTGSTQAPKRAMLTAFNDSDVEEFTLGVDGDPEAVRGASPSRQQPAW